MDFQRTVTISPLPEHQEGHVISDWEITDENEEFWTVEKDSPRPGLKEGEDTLQSAVLSKREWKRG